MTYDDPTHATLLDPGGQAVQPGAQQTAYRLLVRTIPTATNKILNRAIVGGPQIVVPHREVEDLVKLFTSYAPRNDRGTIEKSTLDSNQLGRTVQCPGGPPVCELGGSLV